MKRNLPGVNGQPTTAPDTIAWGGIIGRNINPDDKDVNVPSASGGASLTTSL